MNAKQYAKYQVAVGDFLASNNVKPGCHGPEKENSEPFFSGQQCECCKATLGGNRETYSFATNDNESFSAAICQDCVYYLAYGRLDDSAMEEVKKSE